VRTRVSSVAESRVNWPSSSSARISPGVAISLAAQAAFASCDQAGAASAGWPGFPCVRRERADMPNWRSTSSAV
jgi:hypothetical protein